MKFGKYGKLLHYDAISIGVGNIQRYTLFECKFLGGIILNIFNTTDQDRFHSHAFTAFSLMVKGWYNEEVIENNKIVTKKIVKSRIIPKHYIHKIKESAPNTVSITFEGPWSGGWNEYFDNGRVKSYGWGRKIYYDSKYLTTERITNARNVKVRRNNSKSKI
jgi:hypothetical protein